MDDRTSKSDLHSKSLKDLEARLKAARDAHSGVDAELAEDRAAARQGLAVGFRLGVEMLVGILMGLVLGLALDNWLGTKPVFMLIMILLGFAAGLLNVYRLLKGMSETAPIGQAIRQGPVDDYKKPPEEMEKNGSNDLDK